MKLGLVLGAGGVTRRRLADRRAARDRRGDRLGPRQRRGRRRHVGGGDHRDVRRRRRHPAVVHGRPFRRRGLLGARRPPGPPGGRGRPLRRRGVPAAPRPATAGAGLVAPRGRRAAQPGAPSCTRRRRGLDPGGHRLPGAAAADRPQGVAGGVGRAPAAVADGVRLRERAPRGLRPRGRAAGRPRRRGRRVVRDPRLLPADRDRGAALCRRRRLLGVEPRRRRARGARPRDLPQPGLVARAGRRAARGDARRGRAPARPRGAQAPRAWNGGRPAAADGRGPRGDGREPDEPHAAPPDDRERDAHDHRRAARPRDRRAAARPAAGRGPRPAPPGRPGERLAVVRRGRRGPLARGVASPAMAEPMDPALVRPRFPALASGAAYLDGPGGAQVPEAVIEAMAAHLRGGTANDGGAFATSRATIELIAQARRAAAQLTRSEPEEIAFGPNMTTLNFLLAHALARTLEPGDEVVVTDLDHDANVAPWLRVAADHDLVVRVAPIRDDATLDVAALEALIGERTRVVAFTLASNAVGSLTDAPRIVRAAHAVGALAWTDGVHYAPHRRPDRAALGVDVLLCSPYKFCGPHLGIAAIRRDLAASWPADKVRPALDEPAGHRFETGTASFEALAGFVAAAGYLASLGDGLDDAYARIRAHEESLSRAVLEGLAGIDGVTVHGIADPARVDERTPTFCLSVDGLASHEASERLGAAGIYTSWGNYYALALMDALGLQDRGGAVRAGFVHYNTLEEAQRLCDALADVAARAGSPA